ncbi:hypothetical protein Pcinc_039918 [Petrolisthes cinctipes]|uniref:Proline-rich transmembrane protein 3/4 domain-containing protein n=1 Tax=Petrolisthes cinctipes TaxID=88211 RepID=A0AAE1BN18_PETCI|nr:hypothetical protein Pcinc_039918 [Petrolisthes cinctipes]
MAHLTLTPTIPLLHYRWARGEPREGRSLEMESVQPCSSDNNTTTATFCQDEDTTIAVNGTSDEDVATRYRGDVGRSGGDWPTVRRELQWALPVHVYGFACLFFMLAFYTFFSILNLR